MYRLNAVINAPVIQTEPMIAALKKLGVSEVEVRTVSSAQFREESRLNYDCVYPELWDAEEDAAYLMFSFADSDAGRAAAYHVEFGLPQIPLNLRYDPVEKGAAE